MATYSGGSLSANGTRTPGSSNTDFHTRRLFDFSDRIADLQPDESPFFVYLSKVGKVPTSDSQFRFLEDRTKVSITDRSFFVDGAQTLAAAGGLTDMLVEKVTGATTAATGAATDGNVSWLVKGMVVCFGEDEDSNGYPIHAIARIENITHNSADTTIQVRTISAPGDSTTAIDNETKASVIGTAYEEGSGAPDVWSQKLENDYGYTQIFKTAAEMTNTSRATVYRGYADEWQRIWNLKLREHKVDIERAMLFGQRGSQNGINYSEGICGNIIYNQAAATISYGGGQLSYTEGLGYMKSVALGEWSYDDLLSDFEVVFDPARGGSSSKLALASLPVISHFNKLGSSNTFIGTSNSTTVPYNFEKSNGAFGHRVTKIETVHGDVTLVKEPLFRGLASGFMALVDLDHVSYRPLVGNGINRDTSITTNVQQADEDLRKDLILTEAGLEVTLPETHALFQLEGV
jgi:hypothetical protein